MSVTHKKDTDKTSEMKAQIKKLQDEMAQKDEEFSKQLTEAQLALCELYESMVNGNG